MLYDSDERKKWRGSEPGGLERQLTLHPAVLGHHGYIINFETGIL